MAALLEEGFSACGQAALMTKAICCCRSCMPQFAPGQITPRLSWRGVDISRDDAALIVPSREWSFGQLCK